MAKVYARMTKIGNVSGRSNYISNEEKQENLIDHEKSRDFDWKEYIDFEKNHQRSNVKNNEARELVIALPNEIADQSPEKRKEIANSLATELLGGNHDYEYALHFNSAHTNFHMHLLFSEREINTEATVKTYKRDMWYDKKTNKMAKANAPGAELRYKKGEPMKNKEGTLRYDSEPFTVKNPKFKTKSWLKGTHTQIKDVLSRYGYHLELFDSEKEIKQRKLFKGSSPEYQKYASTWNLHAKKNNADLRQKLAPVVADRDRYKAKLDQYDHPKYQKLNSKMFKSRNVKAELQELQLKQDDISQEMETLTTKYALQVPEGPRSTGVLDKLNELIGQIMREFRSIKQNLIQQIGTIERLQNLEQSQKRRVNNLEPHETPKKVVNRRLDDLLEQSPQKRQKTLRSKNKDDLER